MYSTLIVYVRSELKNTSHLTAGVAGEDGSARQQELLQHEEVVPGQQEAVARGVEAGPGVARLETRAPAHVAAQRAHSCGTWYVEYKAVNVTVPREGHNAFCLIWGL